MITAENTYTREYLEANCKYCKSLSTYKNYIQRLIITLIFTVLLLIWLFSYTSSIPLFMIIKCIIVVYAVSQLISILVETWKLFFFKKRLTPDGYHRKFIFGDDSFGMISQKENYYAERYRRYPSLYLAIEWGDWFFVYYTPAEVCIIKNTDLTEGTPDELRQLLKDKLGSRFSQKGIAK